LGKENMGFTLQAVIGDESDLKAHAPGGVLIVRLAQDKALIPLDSAMRERLDFPFLDFGHSQEALSAASAFVAGFKKKVAYVEAEYFGGAGGQSAAVWEDGSLVLGPIVAESAINQALRALGVLKEKAVDEFDALNLGQHRDTDDWK
jgi:hypothetical protein